MATAIKLKNDIKKLKAAIGSKATPKSFLPKLKAQIDKAENELASLKKGGSSRKTSTSKSTVKTLTSLQKIIQKRKYGVYQGAGVDLKKDAVEGAFATGRRVSKGLKSNQWGDKSENKGNVYYEYRPNRLDVKQPKKKQTYPKLEKGGYMADGGKINKYILSFNYNPSNLSNKDAERIVTKYTKNWKHNNDFDEVSFYVFNLTKEDADMLSKELKMEDVYNIELDYSRYASGGYMAKGGRVDDFSDKIQEGDIVWDSNNKRYGVVLNTYDYKYGEIRLDSDGNQPIEDLYKLGSEGDKGTKEKLKEALLAHKRLMTEYPDRYDKVNYASGGYMAKGGETKIDNDYSFKTAKDIWEMWNFEQKRHFLEDHAHDIENGGFKPKGSWKSIAENQSWDELNDVIKTTLTEHIAMGQYADGGYMAEGGELHRGEEDKYAQGGMMFKESSFKDGLDEGLSHLYEGLNNIEAAMSYLDKTGQSGMKKSFAEKIGLDGLKNSIEKIDQYLTK